MANKWQITLDVTEGDVKTLVGLLEAEVSALQSVLELTADEEEWFNLSDKIEALEKLLKAQITLAWIEKEFEIIPPPSEWSLHTPVAVHSDVLRKGTPHPTREMKRRGHNEVLDG